MSKIIKRSQAPLFFLMILVYFIKYFIMKRTITSLVILMTSAIVFTSKAQSNTLPVSVQDSIHNAFTTCIVSGDPGTLTSIRSRLQDIHADRPDNLILYWTAYTDYRLTVLHMQTGNDREAAKAVSDGISLLEGIRTKTSDDYALLSLMQGMSIQYRSMNAASISTDMIKNASLALGLDPDNLRANYACGIADFFTPEEYGGGQAAEKYFLKAISLPAQKVPSKYHPSWGGQESYEYLVRLYLKQGRTDMAGKYCSEGLKAYPASFMLNSLKEQTGK